MAGGTIFFAILANSPIIASDGQQAHRWPPQPWMPQRTGQTGGTITSNDLLYQTIYPSVVVGQPPSAVSNSYNVLGNHPRLGPWLMPA